ncbi:MAG: STY0301 family protein [Pseudomonadota bacterium]
MSLNSFVRSVLICVFFAVNHGAMAKSIGCPEIVNVEEKISATPPGWQSHIDDQAHPLVNVAFYSGHPRERASLVPISENHSGATSIARWKFTPGDKLGNWILCKYLNTNATYIQPLEPNVRLCKVSYKNYPNTDVKDVVSIVCD